MRFNAGHALNYFNVQPIAALRACASCTSAMRRVARGVCRLREAVRQMKALLREAAATGHTANPALP
jgi:pyridoxine 5-phosphate synthase